MYLSLGFVGFASLLLLHSVYIGNLCGWRLWNHLCTVQRIVKLLISAAELQQRPNFRAVESSPIPALLKARVHMLSQRAQLHLIDLVLRSLDLKAALYAGLGPTLFVFQG